MFGGKEHDGPSGDRKCLLHRFCFVRAAVVKDQENMLNIVIPKEFLL
jgi:hypothetical protein